MSEYVSLRVLGEKLREHCVEFSNIERIDSTVAALYNLGERLSYGAWR